MVVVTKVGDQPKPAQNYSSTYVRKGVVVRLYNPRRAAVGYRATLKEMSRQRNLKLAAEMWKGLDWAQRKPFYCLAYGQTILARLTRGAPPASAKPSDVRNTLNRGYLRFLNEFHAYWTRRQSRMPDPETNLFRVFWPSKDPAPDVVMILDCRAYKAPVEIERSNASGQMYKGATVPHLGPHTIYFLPYGLGCQHWAEYGSGEISQQVATEKPPVLAHDFRLVDMDTDDVIYSQDPREWEYTGDWPDVSEYTREGVRVAVEALDEKGKTLKLKLFPHVQPRKYWVYWGRMLLGSLWTKPVDDDPNEPVGEVNVEYTNYHHFRARLLKWQEAPTVEWVPIFEEWWSYIEHPGMEAKFYEQWSA